MMICVLRGSNKCYKCGSLLMGWESNLNDGKKGVVPMQVFDNAEPFGNVMNKVMTWMKDAFFQGTHGLG